MQSLCSRKLPKQHAITSQLLLAFQLLWKVTSTWMLSHHSLLSCTNQLEIGLKCFLYCSQAAQCQSEFFWKPFGSKLQCVFPWMPVLFKHRMGPRWSTALFELPTKLAVSASMHWKNASVVSDQQRAVVVWSHESKLGFCQQMTRWHNLMTWLSKAFKKKLPSMLWFKLHFLHSKPPCKHSNQGFENLCKCFTWQSLTKVVFLEVFTVSILLPQLKWSTISIMQKFSCSTPLAKMPVHSILQVGKKALAWCCWHKNFALCRHFLSVELIQLLKNLLNAKFCKNCCYGVHLVSSTMANSSSLSCDMFDTSGNFKLLKTTGDCCMTHCEQTMAICMVADFLSLPSAHCIHNSHLHHHVHIWSCLVR